MEKELWNPIGKAKWKVGNDIIQATPGSGPGYLVSKGTFGDFELTLSSSNRSKLERTSRHQTRVLYLMNSKLQVIHWKFTAQPLQVYDFCFL